MSTQWKWVIGILSVVVVVALLACVIFLGWRYFFPGKPSVVIIAPPSNYQVLEGDGVTVEARATGRSIARIELWVDDGLVDTATSPSPQDTFPAALTWQASGVGRHTVEVRAYDAREQASDPAAIILIVATGVAEATPTVTLGPAFETPTATPTATPTSPPAATVTPTTPPPTATPVPPTATPTTPPPTATPTPTPGPPEIESFTADPVTITAGESSTLSWGLVSNATGVVIDQAIGGVGTPGSVVVTPGSTTTYTMTAVGPGGTDTASVTVTVNPAPVTVTRDGMGGGWSGTVYKSGGTAGGVLVGDTSGNDSARGFVSFNIADLAGKDIVNAELDLSDYYNVVHDPWSDLVGLWVGWVEFSTLAYTPPGGAHPMADRFYAPPGVLDVTSYVEARLGAGADKFQVSLHFAKETDSDGAADYIQWGPPNNIHLTITYNP